MKILLSNDDGYRAAGIVALHEALREHADVTVIAPEHNNSARSNALSVGVPLYVREAENGFLAVSGTPADCVHLALTGLLDERPDLVVSGINNGANMGDDTIYSGTVGAAMEGYLFGVPAMAFSQVDKGWAWLEDAARAAADLVLRIGRHAVQARSQAWLLNVNIPNLPQSRLRSPRVCRLGQRHAAQPAIKMQDPSGQTMYWVGPAGEARDNGEGTDFHAVSQGHIALTPLTTDLCDHAALAYWAQGLGQMLAKPGEPG